MARRALKPFDKYWYYSDAVQAPDVDVRFFRRLYKKLSGGREASFFREDFCGTFANLCEWIKQGPRFHGVGIDLDPRPLNYGRRNYLAKLRLDQQKRVHLHQANVLHARVEPADVIAALNFSYFIFKKREDLVRYFRNCRHGLKKNGLFVVDCFGGPLCQKPITDRTRRRGYTYLWEQASFDPVTHHAQFYIHFKRKGERIRKRVFSYDWRLWTIAEIRDAMTEAGFGRTEVYWEGDNGRGGGSGTFHRVHKGEVCDAWIAYVVALP